MVAILADIIILALILGYCAYLVYGIVKRFKNGVIQGCGGSCAGCSGCGGGCCSSDPDEVKKMIENMFYLFVIVIVLYIVGASIYQAFLWFRKWQEKKRDEKFSMDNEENKE